MVFQRGALYSAKRLKEDALKPVLPSQSQIL
jgi:hypothetical protein